MIEQRWLKQLEEMRVAGILAYGSYIPRRRLLREAITTAPALGVSASNRGTRSVAGYDEDTTTMGVAAAQAAMANLAGDIGPDALYFATVNPAYLEKTNATVIHAVLDLPRSCVALDMLGSVRAGAGALQLALEQPKRALVVLSDIRTSLPGGADERDGGDAATAFVMTGSAEPVLAELIGSATVTDDFLDRWRAPTAIVARRWEERFGQEIYHASGKEALNAALQTAGLSAADIAHFIVGCANNRAVKSFARAVGVKSSAVGDDLAGSVGNTGVVHAGLLLSAALDRANPGEVIAVVTLADGAHAMIFRATQRLPAHRAAMSVTSQLAQRTIDVPYTAFLQWRGMLTNEQPRRPDPTEPGAPSVLRAQSWKLALNGSRCTRCEETHFPSQRVCQRCGAVDEMQPVPMHAGRGTVVTSTVDRLAWSPFSATTFAVVNLEGGGRLQTEVTELEGIELRPGARLEMTFRRMFTTRSDVHNYFWKMRPCVDAEER
jgi:3-hydroxy-3-methylglutaryl CoA synthase